MTLQIKVQITPLVLLLVFGLLTIVAGAKCLISHSTSSYLFILICIDNLLLIINMVLLVKGKKQK